MRDCAFTELAPASNISPSRPCVPHSAGDLAPAGGGRYLPSVLNTWPMKPSGVQLASPMLPLGLQTRNSSAAALSWFGVNITPKVEIMQPAQGSCDEPNMPLRGPKDSDGRPILP